MTTKRRNVAPSSCHSEQQTPMSEESQQRDISKLTPQEQRIYQLYGKLPTRQQILANKLNTADRKFFDSGDYALNKAGFKNDVGPGGISNRHLTPNEILRLNRGSVSGSGGAAGRRLSVSSSLERESTDQVKQAEEKED